MTEFDIEHFANFRPPRYLCPRCLGVDNSIEEFWGDWPEHWKWTEDSNPKGSHVCHVCGLRYIGTQEFDGIHNYLKRWDCVIEYGELTERFRVLAEAANHLRKDTETRSHLGWPALRCLYQLLNQARCFVHFVTWGLSWDFIGMLALLSHRVKVRGIVSRCDEPKARQILDSVRYGGHGFEVIPLTLKDGAASPHQKLIVIDGFVAITGSANLTINSWDNVDKGLEHVVVETRPAEVTRLNNTLFSPVWAHLHPVEGNTVYMKRYGHTWRESITRKIG